MRRGLSLAETIVALFLLVAAMLVMINLFHSALRYRAMVVQQMQATALARKVMAEVRDWARDPVNFDSNWSPYRGVTLTDPDYPGLSAEVDCDELGRALYSPSTQLETLEGARARVLTRSLVPVRVQVNFGRDREVTLFSYVGERPRPLGANPVVVTRTGGSPDPVPRDGTVDFGAQLLDSGGQPVADVTFDWAVKPVSGNAMLDRQPVSRDFRSMVLVHRMVINDLVTPPEEGYASGTIEVQARARYHGQEVTNATVVSVLLQ
ncbi:MAG: hypothetical protein KC910_14095 [Candidatus Eremiobacteraeota bacterium]|nr:hypothetical protein [Candidatus Eremiobacteraeota bacterium]